MNCQVLLKRSFVGIVFLALFFSGAPYAYCVFTGRQCAEERKAASEDARWAATLVLAAIAQFANNDRTPSP